MPNMTDHDALINAILAEPDDDTARLVYADFIEELGEVERATFIRTQIELARCQPWDRFAIVCSDDHRTGQPWRNSLPWAEAWSPQLPFHRGFGYALKVHRLQALLDYGGQLFASAPIGELHLPGASRDEYRQWELQPWLVGVKSIRFWSGESPTEGVRGLCASPFTTAVESLHFGKASGIGMSILLEDLLESRIGRQLRELVLHAANAHDADFFEPFAEAPPEQLQRFKLTNVSLSQAAIERLEVSAMLPSLQELSIHYATINDDVLRTLVEFPRLQNLERLEFQNLTFRDYLEDDAKRIWFPNGVPLPRLKLLDLSGCYGLRTEVPRVLRSLAELRVLRLSHMRLADDAIDAIIDSSCWANLVELVLDRSEFTERAAVALLRAERPPSLARIVLDAEFIERFPALTEHYADALVTR
jgi:uncharacterized protein (TIGR02996 family)